MNPVRIQLDDFYRFAQDRLQRSSTAESIDELFESWRLSHPSDNETMANMKAGDTGVPAEDVIAELRREFHLKAPERVFKFVSYDERSRINDPFSNS
ncbi:hypothetical protein M4951_19940 [Blastopirellula sp. J2-11]|uniref:hypothetical protein n=1 Tax=Blastopirellula sp. J2-11 TaxID=2943192 RepID=UPI0021C6A997|nr:hypothetical protein [Blastopirellula sp. J2-11]UUO05634.1 hypothetical protein M4951_19940 [Blastopirellula sp. J2-11]